MAHLKMSKSCLLLATLLCLASSCQAQGAVQIAAKAAICFDNQTVIKGCLKAMGMNGSSALCSPPCSEEMMVIAGCVDGILSNFSFYRPGLLQGVKAIFEMTCAAINSIAATSAAVGAPGGVSSSSGHELELPVWMLPWMMLAALLWF